jgi:hypothetical protein
MNVQISCTTHPKIEQHKLAKRTAFITAIHLARQSHQFSGFGTHGFPPKTSGWTHTALSPLFSG